MTAMIPVGQHYFAVVDDDDAHLVTGIRWSPLRVKNRGGRVSVYARGRPITTEVGPRTLLMHRLILGVNDRTINVDHIDRDPLNNIRANLRLATTSQNIANRGTYWGKSGYVGVHERRPGRFYIHIEANKKRVYGGPFLNVVDAARARDALALHHFGEYAYLNFPRGDAPTSSHGGPDT